MIKLQLIIIYSSILIIGFIQNLIKYRKTKNQESFFVIFHNKYFDLANQYLKNNTMNDELYHWLTRNSDKAQREIGIIGFIDYKPAFSNNVLRNYPFIVNTLPQFRNRSIHIDDLTYLEDLLVRFLGIIEERKKANLKNLINPIIWFREGVQFILSIPFYLLLWSGIIGSTSKNKLLSNLFFKIFVGFTSLVTLISGLVTIIVGKSEVIKFLRALFN